MHADNHGCEQQSSQLSADCIKQGTTRQISCSFTCVPGFQSLELPSFFHYLDLKLYLLSKPEVSESWDSQELRFEDYKVKHHVGTASASAAFMPVPLAEWHMAPTSAFSQTTKTFQILPSAHHRAWCLMAKSTSWVLPNKNNLRDRVPLPTDNPNKCSEVAGSKPRQMKPVSQGSGLLDAHISSVHHGNFCLPRAAAYFACIIIIMLSCL